jgi:hypothetical protein
MNTFFLSSISGKQTDLAHLRALDKVATAGEKLP